MKSQLTEFSQDVNKKKKDITNKASSSVDKKLNGNTNNEFSAKVDGLDLDQKKKLIK